MEGLLLKSQNPPHRQICHLLHISQNTLRAYFRDFLAGGVEMFKQLNFFRPEGDLMGPCQTLAAYFQDHPPATMKEARAKIEEFTGVRRGLTQLRHFLKSIGLRRWKVGVIPGKAKSCVSRKSAPCKAGRNCHVGWVERSEPHRHQVKRFQSN